MLQSQSKTANYTATFDDVVIAYHLFAHADSTALLVKAYYKSTNNDLGLYLGYKIREYKGAYSSKSSEAHFLMPLSDTVTITWYDGNGDSLPVTLRVNSKFFEGIPFNPRISHQVFHPGDTKLSYVVGTSIYDSTTGSWQDSTGKYLFYTDTLLVGDSIITPVSGTTHAGAGYINMSEVGFDTIPMGIVQRYYLTTEKASCWTADSNCVRL